MKCGPDGCPILAFSDLTPAEQRVERGRSAKKMYDNGFTMEQVAKQLGVTTMTISRDLAEFSHDVKTPLRTSKRGRKGEGRPKSTRTRAEKAPRAVQREEKIAVLADAGMTAQQIAAEVGLGVRAVHQAMEHIEIKREAGPIDAKTLSMSAQEKLNRAIREHKAALAASFNRAVADKARERLDEMLLPEQRRLIADASRLYDKRKGLMDKDTFNTIRRALHPDSRNSISDKKLGEAFEQFMRLEKYLLNEKDSPTDLGDLPSSVAEWDKMRVKRNGHKANNSIRPR